MTRLETLLRIGLKSSPLQRDSGPSFGKITSLSELPEKYTRLWDLSAFLLGNALETVYKDRCFLVKGKSAEDGFYHDCFLLENPTVWMNARSESIKTSILALSQPAQVQRDIDDLLHGKYGKESFLKQQDLSSLEKTMKSILDRKLISEATFAQFNVSKTAAATIFAYSPFKLAQINRIEGDTVSLYRMGDFIDILDIVGIDCSSIMEIKAIDINKSSSARLDARNPQALSRISGVSFDSKQRMKEYATLSLQASQRNHREIGNKQLLFAFDKASPGSPFFLPHGTRIFQKLLSFLRKEYELFGFEEVITPLVFKQSLWEQSGHWENYKDNMYTIIDASEIVQAEDASDGTHGLKPMNCPGHCLLYGLAAKSYRDLPLRLAEFSSLHRNEVSGALTGLTRVRKFHQDDGHIFCTRDQILQEIVSSLAFVDKVYRIFGFPTYQLALSTRPDTYIGRIDDWDIAENALKQALESSNRPYIIKQGDGAFYGPKIDIQISDATGRSHQTATIQLDFQLPQRFNLSYQDCLGQLQRPVIIHRAILGSIERMLAILIEHYAGKWPFWLNPRQAIVIPVNTSANEYAHSVVKKVVSKHYSKFYVDVDDSDRTLSKRIREAQMMQYSYILVVGDVERESGNVTVRQRDGEDLGQMDIQTLIALFETCTDEKK